MEDINEIWDKVLGKLKITIPEPTYSVWVSRLEAYSYIDGEFCVLSGHNLAAQILSKTHNKSIVQALAEVIGTEVAFRIIYDEEIAKKWKKIALKERRDEFIKELETKALAAPSKYEGLKQMQSSCNLNLKYKFENFVVGANNKFAYAASYAVAQDPGKRYNPLFIYGGSGLGKTHLLQAIGHEVLYHKKLKVRYIKTEDFINDLVDSLAKGMDKSSDKNGKMSKFRDKYRSADVLLIDDIQLIEGKKRTEEEIFNTFETLHNAGKQIVLTSDRPPESFENTPDRLKSRFKMGLLVDVQVPDVETRMAILLKLAEHSQLNVPKNVIEFLAQIYCKNIRELEGGFNKIKAYSEINEVPVTIENIKKIINYSENRKTVTLQDVLDTVCEFYNVTISEVKGKSRAANLVKVRQVVIYLAKELTQESLKTIGDFLNRTHTTVIYSHDQVKHDMIMNMVFAKEISKLIEQLSIYS